MSQHFFKSEGILLNSRNLYFVSLHIKLSSLLHSSQLTDIFSYEVLNNNIVSKKDNNGSDGVVKRTINKFKSDGKYILYNRGIIPVIVYNFHLIGTQERLYIFLSNSSNSSWSSFSKKNVLNKSTKVSTLTELFFAANWLEREVAELSGIGIKDKKDLRNLMLQYGDSSSPFQKSFPSIGLKEMYYNPVKDTIIQNKLSLQI